MEKNTVTPMIWVLREPPQTNTLRNGTTPTPSPTVLSETIDTISGDISIRYAPLSSGRSMGMDALTIDTGSLTATILPDRGMGLWKCWCSDLEFGWQSPNAGPVHPSLVPVHDASGIGWLEGFDELLVRCGLHSNGAPEFDAGGKVMHPLHGRIANLPAHKLEILVDANQGILDCIGTVRESRFLIHSLELQTRYRFRAGSSTIEVTDVVANRSSQPASMQLLYHINVGQPILQSGSKIYAPYRNLSPRNAHSAQDLANWNLCQGPASGFQEQVYFIEPVADSQHWSEAMLTSADESFGFAVQFDTRTLPYLNLWKNTVAVEDGYVVGLEPATGFPNVRSFEEKNGRVITLQGGESKSFRLKLLPLSTSNEVTQARSRIESMQSFPGVVRDRPQSGISSDA